jgi:nucleotide-binding universal stress UspA family protein
VRRILVAVDGSQNASEAAEYALGLARSTGAELSFLHVVEDVRPGEEAEILPGEVAALVELQGLAREAGIEPSLEVAVGETAAEITDAILGIAAGADADLIVVGSRGLGPMKQAVLGSVSHGVVTHAEIPVLVFKRGA